MTWTHFSALLVGDSQNAHARIECDKHEPRLIVARIGYYHNGIVGSDVLSRAEPNTLSGESKLVKKITAWANVHDMEIRDPKFTRFSHKRFTKTKGKK